MTTDDLTALQALLAKMTPTPWDWSRTALEPSALAWSIQPGVLIADGNDGTPGGDEIDRANALGIVALVNSADALITEVLALRAENERLREALRILTPACGLGCLDVPCPYPNKPASHKDTACCIARRAALGEQAGEE